MHIRCRSPWLCKRVQHFLWWHQPLANTNALQFRRCRSVNATVGCRSRGGTCRRRWFGVCDGIDCNPKGICDARNESRWCAHLFFVFFVLSLRPHTQWNQGRSVGLHAENRFCANKHVTWQPVDEMSSVWISGLKLFFGNVVAHGSVFAWWARIKSKEGLFGLGTFATRLLFDIVFSCVHSLSPAVGESLLRQICGVYVTVSDHRRFAIHHRFAMSWPYRGHGLVCRAVAEGLGRAAWSGVE